MIIAALDAEALCEDLLHQYDDSFTWHAQPKALVGQIRGDVPIPTSPSLSEEHLSMLPSRGLSSSTLRALASSNNEPTLLDQWWWLEGADAPQHVTSIAERTCLLNNARTYRCRTTCFGTGAEAQLRAHATTVRSRRFLSLIHI